MINNIQTGAYKNIYNPENFYVHKEGTGAGNNWAAGYSMGEQVHEEVMDMIDREADGSDSLEVSHDSGRLLRSLWLPCQSYKQEERYSDS